ncbi:response regulator [Mariprofundus erugo]|uniref:histidine kinase n=1 Tax=Mariprofundus erugo TaxID=2528639 RepID=A0A5R9GU02_9PROT|nr:response regulator [Mariprofundus erugo]TLS66714.1 response regulator [Mariprofundus erugo]
MPFRQMHARFSDYLGNFVVLLFLLFALLVSWLSLNQIRKYEMQSVVASLHAVNFSTADRLRQQSERMVAESASLTDNEPLHGLMLACLQADADEMTRFALRQQLASWLVAHGFSDFYIVNPDGHIAAGMRQSDQGKVVSAELSHKVTEVLHGEALLTHPLPEGRDVRMWLLTPLYDQAGKSVGVFALVLGEERHFAQVARLGRYGSTVETYLVDRQGWLLTPSRFEDELIAGGQLKPGHSSVLAVRAMQPHTDEPTFAVAHMLDAREGMNAEGYIGYRGGLVAGVWQWDRLHDAAIITEIDMGEALGSYQRTRNLLLLLLGGLLVSGGLVARSYAGYRRRLERQDNELRNLLLESTAEAIFGLDLAGRCTFANQSCLRMLGYESAGELMGRNMHLLLHHSHADGSPYDEQLCKISLSYRNKTRMHCREEVFWRRDGSSFPVEYWSHPMFDESGHVVGCVVTFLDITELRKAEEQRNRIEKQIQHTQRLESMGVLAGGIAHDFNNILSAILGNAALASRKVISDPLDAREKLEKVVQSCDRASVLCRQMLAYSGKGKFVVRQLNLSAMVEEVTHLLEVSLDKGVVIKYSLADPLPLIEADEAQMQQVVMNLVTNANEAIAGRSGVISITTGVMHADLRYLMDCYGDNPVAGRFAYVEVSDAGCGMDAATQQRIFDPFFTTKFTGRGLGMSAVLGIVRGHHGALKLYSEPGKGTTFKLLLPVCEQAESSQEAAIERVSPWQGSGLVMVVDDEETVRETAVMLLEDMGFTTLAAADGMEALELFRARGQEIRAVLMDLTMPRMGGEECFRELRRINPDVRVVLTSGYNEQDAIQTFTGKRLAGFIQKPVSPDRLRKAMHEAVGG